MVNTTKKTKMYIIGAGLAGTMLAKEISEKKIFGTVMGFFDDDPSKIRTSIDGIPVLGSIEQIELLIKVNPEDEALIAIPSIASKKLQLIYGILKKAGFRTIKLLPAIAQIIEGDAHLVQTRVINPQDLLARDPVSIDLSKSLAWLRKKRVLITGAGGSIGSEISRQLLSGGAERIYLFGHGENSIYQIEKELKILQEGGVGEKATIVPIIGELKDKAYMNYIMGQLNCDVVFHAAAYKHVPLMEANPVAVIENNVFGTKNLVEASITHGVKKFVLISTDKAVEPVSIYGISKMLCEHIVMQASIQLGKNQKDLHNTAFMFVRFGNVLGSRGSIIPLFIDQINKGGPVTVTDPKMIRYFMTIPEACSLVLKTGGVGKNKESYALDMGEPVKIIDIAEQLIQFMGYTPYKDIAIETIGIRPGERLDEPLWAHNEVPVPTAYSKILYLQKNNQNDLIEASNLNTLLDDLEKICVFDSKQSLMFRDKTLLLEILKKAVPSYKNYVEGLTK